MVVGYCVKCKKKNEILDGKESKTKKGTRILKGKCIVCGTKMCRMLGK